MNPVTGSRLHEKLRPRIVASTLRFCWPISWPRRQFLTRQFGYLERFVTTVSALAILAALTATGACRSGQSSASKTPTATNSVARRGGSLIASIRTEPGSFNRYVHRDAGAELVAILTHAKLVRINKATQAVEPWLADSWSASEDGRAFTLKLHPGVTFSDRKRVV